MFAESVDAARIALAAAGFDVRDGEPCGVVVSLDDTVFTARVQPVAYATAERVETLLNAYSEDGRPLVVADRITSDARDRLTAAGWSWLDRRGRLHVRAPGVRVDADVPSSSTLGTKANGPAVTGLAGVAVAYWLCTHPGQPVSPRGLFPALGISPSTISDASQRLSEAGLVDEDRAGIFPELFFELAEAWKPEWTWLASAPDPEAARSVSTNEWRQTGTAAAGVLGAPVVTTGGEPPALYVGGPIAVSIAARTYGTAAPGVGAARVATAPVAAICADDGHTNQTADGWPTAPIVAVALDLAQDRARGREILAGWATGDGVWR